jgi:predicted metalloprotease with PDZ domain
MRLHRSSIVIGLAALPLLLAGAPPAPVSAPITDIRYDVTFNRETAAQRTLAVTMQFTVGGAGDVLLSLPAWTPGAYEVTNFARWVSEFGAKTGDKDLTWDKLDYDTWRIHTGEARQVAVRFDYLADSLDNAMAWSRPDFAFFNGTNVFLYPEGRGFAFPATVTIHTETDWTVATGMVAAGQPLTFRESNYHDLVDKPFLVGRIDFDSQQVAGAWTRLATYPAGMLAGEARAALWHDIERMIPAESAVFGETPWPHYTVMAVFDSGFGGGSALEHQNSHLGIYTPQGIGQSWLSSVTAHEIFHAWNVKRMRPADMWPYRYDQAEPTPWLWVSEGITDYYADLALVRPGIIDSTGFFETTAGKVTEVEQAPAVALEDASLSTWIHPTDGSGYLYYPKGSLAGLMLDIMIRDASNNARSLDDVMRTVYRTAWKTGRGFTAQDWWGAVSQAAGSRAFADFNARYVDGREAYPWDSVLPLAGLKLQRDTTWFPRLGINTRIDSSGVMVTGVLPGGAAQAAGLEPGDVLVALGDIPITGEASFARFRNAYAGQQGVEFPIRIRRNGSETTLRAKVVLMSQVTTAITADPGASPKAARVRHGILTGTRG